MVKSVLKKGGCGKAMFDGFAMVVFLLSHMVFKQAPDLFIPEGLRAVLPSRGTSLSFYGTVVGCTHIQPLLIQGKG